MLSQDYSYRLSTDLVDDAASNGVLRQKADRPACPSFRRRAAHERDQRSLLRAIQLGYASWARVLRERMLEAALEIPMRYPRNFAWIGSQRRGRGVDRHPSVEHQQRLASPPDPGRLSLPLAASTP